MDNDYITRKEHEEYAKRIDDENDRQNARLAALENTVTQIGNLTSTVKELAVNMANMVKEQEKQGERLDKMEGRDGEKWRSIASHIATSIVSIIVAYLFMKIGM